MTNKYRKGSLWRKRDLHVHTPFSIFQNYGGDTPENWEKYISDLENLPKDFAVLGINDYLFLEGYEKVLSEKNKGRLKNIELLLPVIEFRIEKFAGIEFKKTKRINLHVIFSDKIAIETIKSQFLNPLEQSYTLEKTEEAWTRNITKQTLEELGEKIKSTVPSGELHKYGSNLEEGFNNLNVDEKQIFKLLEKDCFKDKYLIAIGKTERDQLNRSDSSIATKKTIINNADIVFTSSESVDNFKEAKKKLIEQGVNDLLLDCSDAHSYSSANIKDKIGKCFTWIKSDPTFDGLKQIIYEPERIFIGSDHPLLDRINTTPGKFIDKLYINKLIGSNVEGRFDNVEIELNHELTVIIGNKGNGKSAISDILGLLGNSSLGTEKNRDKNFSFLNKDRFLQRKLGASFEAGILWLDKSKLKRNLFEFVQENETERVKYLPQRYFENICNDIEKKNFEEELNNVVFSNLDRSLQLGKSSFNELIRFKTEEIDSSINSIKDNIRKLNEKIIELETQSTKSYKEKINNLLKEKENELKNIEEPKKVEMPNGEKDKTLIKAVSEIEEFNKKILEIDKLIGEKESEKIKLQLEFEEIDKLFYGINILKTQIKEFENKNEQLGLKYEINIKGIFTVEEKTIKLFTALKQTKLVQIKQIDDLLYIEDALDDLSVSNEKKEILIKGSLYYQKAILNEQINKLKDALNKPLREYQEYQEKYKLRELKQMQIKGNSETVGTIEYYKSILDYLNKNIKSDLKQLRTDRIFKSIEIYNKKKEIVDIYNSLSEPIKKIISKYKDSFEKTNYSLSINVGFKLEKFENTFLDFIDKTKQGIFLGNENAFKNLKQIIDVDINQEAGIKEVLETIINELEKDRDTLHDQIKKDKLADFYDYLFCLDYIAFQYELRLDNKSLEQLSPGEKGSLLLIFYLMLDTKNIPLIIDQPEDNLDNETVSRMLVPFIKGAKKYRQIIIVTHNPNLAVVADAEEVVFVEIDKKNNNLFKIFSGSIESNEINDIIVKILEGTKPAFDKRKLRYRN